MILCVITKGHVSRPRKPVSFPRTQSSHLPAFGLSSASVAQQPPGHPEPGYQPRMTPVITYNYDQPVSTQETAKEYCVLGERGVVDIVVILGEVVSVQDETRKARWGTSGKCKG